MRKTIEYLILKELFFLTMNVTDSIVRNRQNQRNNLVIGFEKHNLRREFMALSTNFIEFNYLSVDP